jgi:hypothetical protein
MVVIRIKSHHGVFLRKLWFGLPGFGRFTFGARGRGHSYVVVIFTIEGIQELHVTWDNSEGICP